MSTPSRSHNAPSRRTPPFGKELAARLADRASLPRWAGTSPDGQHLSIWVSIGPNSWQWAREHIDHRLLLIVPSGEDPAAFDWRILAGHDPVILFSAGDTSSDEIKAAVLALMTCGVNKIIHGGPAGIVRYRREGTR